MARLLDALPWSPACTPFVRQLKPLAIGQNLEENETRSFYMSIQKAFSVSAEGLTTGIDNESDQVP